MHYAKSYSILSFVRETQKLTNETEKWLRGQAVKTLASHAGIRGSIPLGVTERRSIAEAVLFLCPELPDDRGKIEIISL